MKIIGIFIISLFLVFYSNSYDIANRAVASSTKATQVEELTISANSIPKEKYENVFKNLVARGIERYSYELTHPLAGRYFKQALVYFEKAFEFILDNDDIKKKQEKEYLLNKHIGMVYVSWGKANTAAKYLVLASSVAPSKIELAGVLKELSVVYETVNHTASVLALLESIHLNPLNPSALQLLSRLEESDIINLGDNKPKWVKTYADYMTLVLKIGHDIVNALEAKLRNLGKDGEIGDDARNAILDASRLEYAAFDIFDRKNMTQEAWRRLENASRWMNHEKAKLTSYNINDDEDNIGKIKSIFGSKFFADATEMGYKPLKGSKLYRKKILFIVGLPRSGSTLLEQMLNAHSSIVARGENSLFNSYLNDFRTDMMNNMDSKAKTQQVLEKWGEKILNEMIFQDDNSSSKNVEVAVDKMLFNFQNIGFIQLIIPESIIIHIYKSNIKSSGFSLFKKQFYLNTASWSYKLEGIVQYYSKIYLPMMKHWDEVLPKGRVIHIKYEDLINNPQSTLERITSAAGLALEKSMIDTYHSVQNPSSILTSSSHQVRKPISNSQQSGWKKYTKQLEPLSVLPDYIEFPLKSDLFKNIGVEKNQEQCIK